MNDESSSYNYRAIFCAFNYITQKLGSRSALGFLTDLFAAVESEKPLTVSHIKVQLKNTFRSLSKEKIKDILSEDSDYDYGRTLAEEFVKRLGFKSVPQALFNGVPMAQNILNVDDFEDAVFAEIMQQTPALQKSVYTEELKDEDDAIEYLMNKPHVMPRLNQRILSNEDPKFLDFTGSAYPNLNNVRILESLSSRDMTATLMENIKYFCGKHSTENISNTGVHFLTLWIFADLDEKEGRELLQNALEYMKISSSMRVAFIPNVEGGKVSRKDNLNRLVWAASQTLSSYEAAEQTINWLNNYSSTPKIPEALNEIISSTELHMKMLRVYCQRVLNIKKSDRVILANGKIFGPLFKDENFSIDDFGLVDRIISHQYGDKIRKVVLSGNDDDFEISSDILLKICTTLVPRETKIRFSIPLDLKDQHSVLKLSPKYPSLPHFEITAVVDPASRAAQKLAPILILLRHVINCEMRVYLSPISQHSDMPVKNFYRFVIQPEVQFTTNGKYVEGPLARFIGLPANPLLTQNLQVPENWLVEVVTSVYDLDNIKLSEIGGPVHSEFELEYLLLEGHCYDSISGAPPRGLQVTLGTADYPTMVDTIVMANLGYFQLKANPGIWELRLREGKSANIYDITNAEGPNTFHVHNSTRVMISSLRSHVIKLRVTKKPTMINADLLLDDEETAPSRIWNKITSSFGRFSDERKVEADIINIFSVASGHLYERLLRIMMVSLLKHTKSPVKFWFLKNYLSPQFTDFLPHMAAEFDFQYELVQYKWPRWLHQQTEKQRTIWGYKILFLDVLFPLSVRKIIFVDADAIVRADIKELYDLDLHEAPYAYTPFCDSRKEMEGFRFWKQGYWRSHLMGRRYHISALYVVDLKKFRKIAAGDRLRGQYQALSQDPNSLSNLDQDLPNNMIHQVAIKSLPDEWLWCETWCSTDSLKYAKVIDLCNNPQTKEAKLTAAQRIVPEWKDYDTELKKLMTKIEDHENLDHSEANSEQPTTTQHNIVKDEQQNLIHHEEL